MSNILDKPLESMFGYISVLPGAFSAYRYQALLGEPLEKYFLGETLDKKEDASIFTSNLYLAEDRVLCFELITKRHEAWILKYVKSARAETDVPEQLPELISQRRRWLNGSFFAAVHALVHFGQIFRSSHSVGQKLLFLIEFVYATVNLLFAWFGLGNFYLAFFFLLKQGQNANRDPQFLLDHGLTCDDSQSLQGVDPFFPVGEIVFEVITQVYWLALAFIFIMSLGNRPQGSKVLYYGFSVLFAFIMGLMLFMSGWSIYLAVRNYDTFLQSNVGGNAGISFYNYFRNTPAFRDLVIATVTTYGLYLFSSLIHMDFMHIFTSMPQYLFLLPTYINILNIYAFCNLHDVTWGTKGDNIKKDEAPAQVKMNEKGERVFDVEVPNEPEEVDMAWNLHLRQMAKNRQEPPVSSGKVDKKTAQDDMCKQFRTSVVLVWVLCNAVLVLIFTNQRAVDAWFPHNVNSSVNPYLTFLFWSVAGISFVRFSGSVLYMIQWYFQVRLGGVRK